MPREEEFEKVKTIIKENYDYAYLRLYFTRNIVGDCMKNLFKGKFFTVDICYGYGYFEVFGCTKEEKEQLKKFYDELEE